MTHLPLNNPEIPTPLDQAVMAHRHRASLGAPRAEVPVVMGRLRKSRDERMDEHRARWAMSNPVELKKELDLLNRHGADPRLTAELSDALDDMIIERNTAYKPTTPTV